MLELLRVRDLALIEDLEMEFSPGMNVLTGETGAGKTFILKALNFLTGEKLDVDLVRPGKEKAVAEALFTVGGEDVILRRELAAGSGRSRLYINDSLSSQDALRDLRARLMLHASQHGQQRLLQPAFQAAILDNFLDRPDLLAARDQAVKGLLELKARRAELQSRYAALAEKRDMLEFQQQEIAKVAPKPGEEEELEQKRETIRREAAAGLYVREAVAALRGGGDAPGLAEGLAVLGRNVAALAKVNPDFEQAAEKVEEMRLSLRDLESELRRQAGHRASEQDVEAIESRLYALAQLKRKLKRPLEAIINLQEEIAENLSFLDTCQLEEKELGRREEALCKDLSGVLGELNPAREKAAGELSANLEGELRELGFSEHVRVIFEFSPASLYAGREDCSELRARLLWQPNPGQAPQPLDRIASGGELSRFLLAVVSLMTGKAEEPPLLIFDEVDAGVGGLTLNKVADRLEKLAADHQMLLITHWPQLAARAVRHFLVEKEVLDNKTFTRCFCLSSGEIPAELSRMAGGGGQGDALARELAAKRPGSPGRGPGGALPFRTTPAGD